MQAVEMTKEELASEVAHLRQRVIELEAAETERKRAEGELRDSEERYRSLFENSQDAILLTAPDGSIFDVNPVACQMLGRTAEEIKQIGRDGLVDTTDPRLDAALKERAHNGKARAEITMIRADGSKFPVDITSTIFTNEQGQQRTSMIIRDITEHKQAEEALRESEQTKSAVLNATPDLVVVVDNELIIRDVNKSFAKRFGKHPEELIGISGLDLVPPELRKDRERYCQTVLQTRQPVRFEDESRGTHFDNILYPILQEQGKVTRIVLNARDITERKKAEEDHLANLKFFESMDKVNRAIQSADDIEEMMKNLLDVVISIFDCDRAYLMYPCDPESPTWTCPMERNKPEYPGVLDLKLELPMDPLTAETQRVLLIADGPVKFDLSTSHALPEAVSKQFDIKSFMAMAIYPKIGSPWNFGIHQCAFARVWTPQEEQLFQEIGHRLADAMTSLLMYRDLKESENKYRELADKITDIFFAMDKDLRYTYWNKASEKIMGIPAKDALGKSLYEIFPEVKGTKVEESYREALKTHHHQIVEQPYQIGDKNLVFEISIYPLNDGLAVFVKDITERKQAEEQLRLNEERYKFLFENSQTINILIGTDSKILDVNESAAQSLGYKKKNIIGKEVLEFVVPDHREEVAQQLSLELNGKYTPPLEIDIITNQGTRSLLFTKGHATLFEKGELTGILLSAVDITERKKAENELKIKDNAIASSNTAIAIGEFGENVTYANPMFLKMWGYDDVKEVLGKPAVNFWLSKENAQDVIEALLKGEPVAGELKAKRKDGSLFDVQLSASLVTDDTGKPISMMASFVDITEQKQAEEKLRESEERFRTIFETAQDFIFIKDKDSKFTAVNPAMERLYGVPASKLIGKTGAALFGKAMAERLKEKDVRVLKGEIIVEEHPSPLKGSTSIHHIIKMPIRNSAGEIIGICGIGRDITERKQMEEALRESEERFRTIVEQAAEAIIAHDLDGQILLVNGLACEYSGYCQEELLSMNALDLDHEILEKDYKRKYWEKLQIGKYVKVEANHTRKDGSSYPAEVYLVKIMFKSQPLILCLARDITERKEAEEKLRESEERFRAVFEGAPDAVFLADPESGAILDANPAASHLLLRSHEEIIGLHQSQLHPSRLKEQIKEVFVKDIKQFKHGKELRPIESAVTRSDGSEVPVEILGHMVFIHGRPVLQGVFRDITKRKQADEALIKSEEKYRLLSENIPVAVYSALPDEHSTNLFLSGQFLELTGYPIEQFFKDPKLWNSMLHPEDRDYVWEKVQEHRQDKDLLEIEYRIITKDKKVKWIRDRAKPVLDEHGEIMRIDGFMEDVSERMQAEQAMRESEEKYRSLVESSEDSIYLVDRNCNYIFLNEKHLARLGVQSSQIIGKGYSEFHSPEESKDFVKRIKTLIKTGMSQTYEYQSQRDNRFFLRTLSPVISPDREIHAITVISKDITGRKQAEEALRESENRFRILVEHSVDAFILHDLEGRILNVNQHTCDSLGYTREELLGLYVHDIDQNVAPGRHMEVWEAMVPGESITLEGVHKRKDGKTFPVEVRLGVFESGGRKLILGLVRDVTERKQAEEKLREREAFNYALFRYNPVETIVVDREGRVTAFNLAKETSGDRLPTIGDRMYQTYAGKHETDMREELMKCIRSGKRKEFPERKYGDKYLNITISPFAQGAIIISEDITERKRTEEALQESEQFSSSLLNDSPNPIIVINPDTSIRYVNPALEKLTGFSTAELLGWKAPYPWWGDEIISKTTIGLKRAIQQGSQRIENHFQTKSGDQFWVEVTSEPVMHDGKVQYLLTNWIDITERKQAEELLQKERDTFYSILERAPYGVMVLDAVGNHSFVNPEFTNITGYTLEDIPTTQEWLHSAYPDQHYRNMVMEMWESDCAQSKDEETFRKRFGRTFARTFNVMCKNGVTKDIEFRTTVIGAELTIVMLSDITDRKRMNDLLESAAAEWRTTFDAISDAVCLLDSHGKIIRCNNAMLKLLGKPFSQVTNHHCWEVMHGVSEAPHSCPIALAGKTNHRETEVMFKDSCWFNISVDPLLDEDGNFLGGVHIMSDISDRMRIQNELQDSREQLRSLTAYLESVREQERTNIAREIHDELAQALTALKMDLSWLNHKLPGEEGSLIEKTKSMNSLIDSTIHTVKRISAELRPGILDDLGLVAAIEWQTEEFQNRTGISCHVIVDPDDIAVDQDLATAIFRIFQETLTNVARHARATRVTVNLKKRAGKLTLRVKDNGIGITEEQISDSRSFGLIGMHERVIPWDGKISLKGIPDKGTTVIVSVGLDHAKKNIDKNSREGSPA